MIFLKLHGLFYRDLGAHIDGFIAVAAHTVIVGSSSGKKVTGRQADVTLAAYWAVQAALRLLKAGNNVSLWVIINANQYRLQATDCFQCQFFN